MIIASKSLGGLTVHLSSKSSRVEGFLFMILRNISSVSSSFGLLADGLRRTMMLYSLRWLLNVSMLISPVRPLYTKLVSSVVTSAFSVALAEAA